MSIFCWALLSGMLTREELVEERERAVAEKVQLDIRRFQVAAAERKTARRREAMEQNAAKEKNGGGGGGAGGTGGGGGGVDSLNGRTVKGGGTALDQSAAAATAFMAKVGRCRLTVSNPVLTLSTASALETGIS